jgi:hypothetical protein
MQIRVSKEYTTPLLVSKEYTTPLIITGEPKSGPNNATKWIYFEETESGVKTVNQNGIFPTTDLLVGQMFAVVEQTRDDIRDGNVPVVVKNDNNQPVISYQLSYGEDPIELSFQVPKNTSYAVFITVKTYVEDVHTVEWMSGTTITSYPTNAAPLFKYYQKDDFLAWDALTFDQQAGTTDNYYPKNNFPTFRFFDHVNYPLTNVKPSEFTYETNPNQPNHCEVPTTGFTFGGFYEFNSHTDTEYYRYSTHTKPTTPSRWMMPVVSTYSPYSVPIDLKEAWTGGTQSFKIAPSENYNWDYKIQLISIEIHENIDLDRWDVLCTNNHSKNSIII